MDFSDAIQELFESDSGGLFDSPKKSTAPTSDDRLAESFNEISSFIERNDRMPEIESEDISEAKLAKRLESIRGNIDKITALKDIDTLGLLEMPEVPKSLDELFSKDEFSLFNSVGNEVLTIKNVPINKAKPVSVERRIPAPDFSSFKQGFMEKQSGLAKGKYKLIRFRNIEQLKVGNYYISLGQMVYVSGIGEKKLIHGTKKARLRCIFENGTESAMYDRSLANDLYEDGYVVVDAAHLDSTQLLTDEDIVKGYVYILKSKSLDPKIASIKDLYKIGFSTNRTFERIKNAEKDPTYLMAPVEIVANYILTGDYNPQKVEHFIHRIFSGAALDLNIIDFTGREYKPKEWYSVPLHVIEQAVNLLQNGEITKYVYDNDTQRMKEI